jgi:hypothetical protein
MSEERLNASQDYGHMKPPEPPNTHRVAVSADDWIHYYADLSVFWKAQLDAETRRKDKAVKLLREAHPYLERHASLLYDRISAALQGEP